LEHAAIIKTEVPETTEIKDVGYIYDYHFFYLVKEIPKISFKFDLRILNMDERKTTTQEEKRFFNFKYSNKFFLSFLLLLFFNKNLNGSEFFPFLRK